MSHDDLLARCDFLVFREVAEHDSIEVELRLAFALRFFQLFNLKLQDSDLLQLLAPRLNLELHGAVFICAVVCILLGFLRDWHNNLALAIQNDVELISGIAKVKYLLARLNVLVFKTHGHVFKLSLTEFLLLSFLLEKPDMAQHFDDLEDVVAGLHLLLQQRQKFLAW